MNRGIYQTYISNKNELYHHGILGQKWGVRRYQNPDGTLTDLGRKHLSKDLYKSAKRSTTISQPLRTGEDFQNKTINAIKNNLSKNDIDDCVNKFNKFIEKSKKNTEDFFDSKECEEASKKAYKDTLDWFEHDDPEYLKEIIEKNNGDKYSLDKFHDFRKTLEGFEDYAWEDARKDWDKVHKNDEKELDKLYKDYQKSCKDIYDKLLDGYGNEKLHGYTVKELLYWSGAIDKIVKEQSQK